ncbi:MAG: ExbD/TolR family protein [Oceanococcaceae bacterium]
MLHRRHRHRNADDQGELNITAFLNLMVILVPFLLITAVFSRLAILEVALPAPAEPSTEQPEEEPLPPPTVLVRADALTLRSPDGTELGFPRGAEGYELAGLNSALQLIKKQDIKKDAAVVLLEADIPYDTLIQVMDAVRLTAVDDEGESVKVPLFPQISLGEIPAGAGS